MTKKRKRTAYQKRKTRETCITANLNLDGKGEHKIITPIGFLSHMLEAFSVHGNFDLEFHAQGDLHVDQHHLLEDSGIVLGGLFDQALGQRKGINRTGYFVFPMDEALAVVAVDISGRPFLQYEVEFTRQYLGDLDTDVLEDFFYGLSICLKANLAVRMPYGKSDHHKMEAIFKALGKSLKMAVSLNPSTANKIPSTKGVMDNDRNN